MFLEVLNRILMAIEEEALKEMKPCERCEAGLIRYGRERRKIRTLVGSVKVLRVRLHFQGCGRDSYPLDEAIGFRGRRGDDCWGEGEGIMGGSGGQLREDSRIFEEIHGVRGESAEDI